METQITLDKNNFPVEMVSQPIDIQALIDDLKQTNFQVADTQATLDTLTAKRDAILAKLTTVQSLPNISTEIVSKIQEVPEFAPVEITPLEILKT